MKTYEIGGKKFRLEELVLDQEEALADLLEPIYSQEGEFSPKSLVDALLRQKLLRKALAVVLLPEGKDVESVDRESVAAHLGQHLKASKQMEIIRDFFEVSGKAIEAAKSLADPKGSLASSTGSSSTSPKET